MNAYSNQHIGAPPQSLKLSPDFMASANFSDGPRRGTFNLENFSQRKPIELDFPPSSTPQNHNLLREVAPSDVPRVLPKAPPIPAGNPFNGRRRRSVSESEASKSNNRRAIFGHYWNAAGKDKTCKDNSARASNGSLRRRTQIVPHSERQRSSSISILESANLPQETVDYRMYAPPKEHSDRSAICSRFAPVDAVPNLEALPPLPTPLRRFCSEGGGTRCLSGMYPLVTPVPILKQSSYRSLHCDPSDSPSTSLRKHPSLCTELDSYNWTQSRRCTQRDLSLTSHSSGSISNSDGNLKTRNVHFDPRITVTEFEDSVERAWYSDFELIRLKHETVILAQEYLMAHRHEAEKYNKVKLDPVTGTYRKRALFSLPVLASTIDDSLLDPSCCEYSKMAEKQVNNILIVDPNPAIQELFRKSMKSMFPKAEIFPSKCGEDALKFVSAQLFTQNENSAFQRRNFDIIIVEQRLCQELHNSRPGDPNRPKLQEASSCLGISSMANTEILPRLQKPGSFAGSRKNHPGHNIDICGSDLIKAILDLESEIFTSTQHEKQNYPTSQLSASPPSIETAIPISTGLFQWRSLLIGVSMQPDRDAGMLTEAGADVIWGKPIPHVGDALRNQLVQSLINKRRRCTAEST